MRRTAVRTRKVSVVPIAPAMPQDDLADPFEDRVGEDLIDYDDEREAVDAVVHGAARSLN